VVEATPQEETDSGMASWNDAPNIMRRATRGRINPAVWRNRNIHGKVVRTLIMSPTTDQMSSKNNCQIRRG
jgi:hypothetical protein